MFNVVCVFMSLSMALVGRSELIQRNTLYGTLQGHAVRIPSLPEGGSRRLDVFVGVPYAKPPIGELRWRRTEYPEPWEGVKNATQFSPSCSQNLNSLRTNSFGSGYNNTDEDCLYLNIYAPRVENDPDRTYAILFWIHGGSYRYGSGEEYAGEVLARDGDVIVVTINYRLGVLGFLSTDDEAAEGNYALWDMIYALHWVRDNIGFFGGDPQKVNIFGNSAGGAAVSTLIFSPEAEGLFRGVITQSGNALSPWAVYRPPASIRPHTEDLARKVGCPTSESTVMVDCLRSKDAMVLVNTPVPSQTDFNAAFAPRIDGTLLRSAPEDLLPDGKFSHVYLLSGTVPDEFSNEYKNVPGIEHGWSRAEKEGRMYVWSRRYEGQADVIDAAIRHEYDSSGDAYAEQRDLFLEMRADDGYVAPHTRHALGHRQFVDSTYMYSFEHRSDNHDTPQWMGVPHTEECYYAFGTPFWGQVDCPWGCHNVVWFPKINWTTEDKTVSMMTMAAWSNFAKTGDPSIDGFTWPKYKMDTEHSVVMSGAVWAAQQFYKYPRMRFWNQFRIELLNLTEVCDGEVTSGAARRQLFLHMCFCVVVVSLAYSSSWS